MIRGCNRDCFHCIFEDCIEDGIDSSERRSINKRDTENQSILPDAVLRQHRVLLAVEKKCFLCGRTYPAMHESQYCECEERGFLYTILK